MLFVTTQPEKLAAAAANLQGIGSALSAGNASAAAHAAAVHDLFVGTLAASAASYQLTEDANAVAAG